MLCQFTFKNYRSYKNETTLDMQAVSSQGFSDSLLRSGSAKGEFLPVSVIYGPNAGGKSNVLNALNCVISLVAAPVNYIEGGNAPERVDCVPFLFDKASPAKPTSFELFFRPDDSYEYKYFVSISGGRILEEYLTFKEIGARGAASAIFKRSNGVITLGNVLKKNKINTDINEKVSYLSALAVNKTEEVSRAIKWFQSCIMVNYNNSLSEHFFHGIDDTVFKKNIIALMNDAGINISGYELKRVSQESNAFEILFEHTVNGNIYSLNFGQESDGTRKLFSVIPHVLTALGNGSPLIFDELDAKLHPKLLRFIIMLFKDKEINKHGAQLIFTSHDVSTMKSSVFRTDEIWFACKDKDESSELYSLYEIRDENDNRISSSAAFDKQYLEGRYGADPYFRNMMNWENL